MKSDKKIAIMVLVTAIMVISVFAFVMPVSAQWPEPVELWSYPTDVTDIAIGDLNGDGKDDVAAIGFFGPVPNVHAISGPDGTLLWDNESVGGFAVDVGDIDGNPGNEVEVIAGGWNDDFEDIGITAYDSDGNFLWFYPTEWEEDDEFVFDIEIGDIDGDDIGDVVACSPEWFTIYAVNGSGDPLPEWPFPFSAMSVAVGDLDGEPGMEVAAMGEDGLKVFNGSGGVMWWFNEWEFPVEGIPVEIGDVDGDGDNEVVIGIGGGVLAFNGTNADPDNPEPIYLFETGDWVTNIELGDLDGEPGVEVVSMGIGDSLYAIDIDAPEEEQEMWSYEELNWDVLNWAVREGIAIGDIDGDSKNEVVAGLFDVEGGVFPEFGVAAFDGVNGDIVWVYETEDPPIDVEVGDLDGDGDDDVVVGTRGGLTIHALATKRAQVPALTPIGLIALVGLLAIIATSTILRRKER